MKAKVTYRSARWLAKEKGQFEIGRLFLLPPKKFDSIIFVDEFKTAKGNIIRREA